MRTLRTVALGALAGAVAHGVLIVLPDSTLSFASPLMLPLIVTLLLAPCIFSRRCVAFAAYFAVLLPAWL